MSKNQKMKKQLKYQWIKLLGIICLIILTGTQSCKPDKKDRMVYKPNIYIYPTEKTELVVKINFPIGGELETTIPEYGNGWNITVDTTGIINDVYTYLFYESNQPDVWQRNYGWFVNSENLDSFFRANLSEYGFKGHEIDDFINYWIPRLDSFSNYAIYPQTKKLIDEVIRLEFSIQPDRILRLFYVIDRQDQSPEKLKEPTIESFARKGYFVTEWGVILN